LEYDIPVINSFILYKAIYELDQNWFMRRLGEFSDLLELKELLHIPVRKLSLGQRMRCEIAASLLHNPKVVFLDEPTIGLDALAKEEIRLFLKRINETENVTIILTTHDMGDIEQLCERIIFINEGRLIYDGPLTTLKKEYASHKDVKIIYDQPVRVPTEFKPVLKEAYDNTVVFSVDYAEAVDIVPALLGLGRARDLSIHEQRLEDVVKIIYKSADNAM